MRRRQRVLISLFSIPLLIAAAGCGSSDHQSVGLAQLTGTLVGEPMIALPPEAVATVRLVDMTDADTPPRVIGEQILGPAGQFPIDFALTYDRSGISASRQYAVQVSIRAGRQVIWTTPEPMPVLAPGQPDKVEVVVREHQ
jgi:putative lipoprotein